MACVLPVNGEDATLSRASRREPTGTDRVTQSAYWQGELQLVKRATALVVICVGLLGGCADNSAHNASNETTALALTADPMILARGERATLSWSASNAAACEASGGWSGAQATAGTFVTPALNAQTTFALSCSGSSGGAVSRVTVDILDPTQDAPKVVLKSSPTSIPATGTATLSWSAVGGNSCQASGGWSGAKSPNGTHLVSGLARDTSFTLSCAGPGGTGVAMTQIVLQRATLRWETPQLADGATLAGFRVQWGSSPGVYSARVEISDPSVRAHVIHLPGPGAYYFTMGALDGVGNETARSNEVSKLIPG